MKIKKSDIKNIIREVLEEEEAEEWGVYSRGGSVGSKNDGSPIATGTKEDMKAKARRMTKSLSPGERKYYKMGYSARVVKQENFAL